MPGGGLDASSFLNCRSSFHSVHDRGYVSLNGVPQGILSRMKPASQLLNVTRIKPGDTLDILVRGNVYCVRVGVEKMPILDSPLYY